MAESDDAADAVVARAKITKTEFLLVQTLIKGPSSGKYFDRLTEFTADVAALCKKPWSEIIEPALAQKIATALADAEAFRKKKIPTKKDKKDKKDKQADSSSESDSGESNKKKAKKKDKKKDKKDKKKAKQADGPAEAAAGPSKKRFKTKCSH